MVTLPLTSNRLHPTLGHVRVQVYRTVASFPERFANHIRKQCITPLRGTVRKIRRIPEQSFVIEGLEKSPSGLLEDALPGRLQRHSTVVFF